MATKVKATEKPARSAVANRVQNGFFTTTHALTMDERLHRIEALRKRIDGYIEFMCQIAAWNGTSAEVKDRAVMVFYEQMLLVEKQLAHIHDELRLE